MKKQGNQDICYQSLQDGFAVRIFFLKSRESFYQR